MIMSGDVFERNVQELSSALASADFTEALQTIADGPLRQQFEAQFLLQAGPDVVRFLPPLTMSDEELATGLARLETALSEAKRA